MLKIATFAGGCFWCLQGPFDNMPGVKSTRVGYSGGDGANLSYDDVCKGNSGHLEAVQVSYDPALVDYEKLMDVFWRNIDPFDATGQFVDQGGQYQTAIFYHDEEQKQLAQAAAGEIIRHFKRPTATRLLPYKNFYPSEEYHQGYYCNFPAQYERYKLGSGREIRLRHLWGQPKG